MSATVTPYDAAWLPGFDGTQFYTRTWAAAKPKGVVLYVHGFGDHIGRYDHIHSRWPQHDITLFAYDLRGFGRTALDEAHRSPGASYGKTSRDLELTDVEWWIEHLAKQHPTLPIFLMGYSAGGGLTLAFATRTHAPPNPHTVARLSGVIANAPLVHLSHRAAKMTRVLAKYLGMIIPDKTLEAPMPEERFSRDPAIVEQLRDDPWRRTYGTVRGLSDMVSQGEQLLDSGHSQWPKDLPLLITHGTADEVNCPKGAEAFYKKLDIKDKKLVLYPDALHDLVNEIDDIPERVFGEFFAFIDAHTPAKSA